MDGFFKVHYVDGKYFFEIADSLFGRDILIVNRVVKAPVDAQKRKVGYPGDYISDEVIRFEKGRGDKLFVREISYLEHSADTLGMYQAVLKLQCSTHCGHLPAENCPQRRRNYQLRDRHDRLYP